MTVNWSRLWHAYGRAIDTPRHLHALEFGDVEARQAALRHLDVAVLHQGFPESSTAPTVRAVTILLAECRVHPDVVDALLCFLGEVATSVTALADDSFFAEVLPELADAVEMTYAVAFGLLRQSSREQALGRAESLVAITGVPGLAGKRAEVADLVRLQAGRAAGSQARWVGCLAQLGVDVRDRLTGADLAVRLRAALAHEDDPRSRQLIVAALAEPLPPDVHRSEVIAAAIRVAADFESIAPAACQIVRQDDWTGFDIGWGALVRFAFARPHRSDTPLTDPQRALLRALVTNDRLWDPKNGSCSLVFTQAGLPYSRYECQRLAQ